MEDYKKKYENALSRASYIKDNNTVATPQEVAELLFPELKESEDERIRKALIESFKIHDLRALIIPGFSAKDVIAWLEKQGEQKPSDEVEPKFKVGDTIVEKDLDECGCGTIVNIKDGKYIFDDGCFIRIKEQECWQLVEKKTADKVEPKFKDGDWIVNSTNNIFKVLCIIDDEYRLSHNIDGKVVCAKTETINKKYHLWTIQDAKDGDVLAFDDENIVIFKDLYNKTTFHSYCHIEDGVFGVNKDGRPDWWESEGFQPATKEQHDLLFSKMEEAGYEWDVEKKELKKIEQKPIGWHKEDEQNLNACLGFIPDESLRRWLKDIIHGKYDKPAWSEEDEKKRELLIAILEVNHPNGYFKVNPINTPNMEAMSTEEIVDWLKSLKERMKGKNHEN